MLPVNCVKPVVLQADEEVLKVAHYIARKGQRDFTVEDVIEFAALYSNNKLLSLMFSEVMYYFSLIPYG